MANRLAHGLWPSPVTPRLIGQGLRLNDPLWDSDGQTLVWLEGRSDRGVLVAWQLGRDGARDLTSELSVRAKVGYGGGDFGLGGGRVVFSCAGRLYALPLKGGTAQAITPACGEVAAPAISPDGKLVLYVFAYERKDGLALVDLEGRCWPRKVAEGRDFYMQPRWSPDGQMAAWVAWDHPRMPWDGSRLFVADLRSETGGLPCFVNERALAGAENVAVFQPEFSPGGRHIAWLADEGGWHNLYVHDFRTGATRRLTDEHEAQLGCPAWAQGLRTWGWSHDGAKLYAVRCLRGVCSLWAYALAGGQAAPVRVLEEYTDLQQPALNPRRGLLAVLASSGRQPPRLLVSSLDDAGDTIIVRRAVSESVPAEAFSQPQPVTWAGKDGVSIHGLLYTPLAPAEQPLRSTGAAAKCTAGVPPACGATQGRQAEGGRDARGTLCGSHLLPCSAGAGAGLPPAIIRVHGGPTAQARAAFSPDIQFFVTRGYLLLDVNYRGSTGYGRAYMEALRGQWGVSDVEDALSGARYLTGQKLADPAKLVLMGGSAGGYTVLRALVTQPRFFKAAVCLYGVSNLFTLAADTHKFEERYLDSLLGPLPEAAAIYRERSPIFHADKIVDPLVIFQGETDEVVPRAQSDAIVESLRRRGVPHQYHVYPGEGHGWRKAETVEAFYVAVEKFLRQFVLFA
ncbi:MAG: S9 family peptidase [Planctomycetota bacterium]